MRAFRWLFLIAIGLVSPFHAGVHEGQAGPDPIPLTRDALAILDPARAQAQALLAKGTPVTPLGSEIERGYRHCRLELWLPVESLHGPEGRTQAQALFALARDADAAEGIRLEQIHVVSIDPISTEARGDAVRLRLGVLAENRGKIAVSPLELRLALLDRRGTPFKRGTARSKKGQTMSPGASQLFELEFLLSRKELRHYHRRRIRAEFFLGD